MAAVPRLCVDTLSITDASNSNNGASGSLKRTKNDPTTPAGPPAKRSAPNNNTPGRKNDKEPDAKTVEKTKGLLGEAKDPAAAKTALLSAMASHPAEVFHIFKNTCKNCFMAGRGLSNAHKVNECKELGNDCAIPCPNCKDGVHWLSECKSPIKNKGKGGGHKK